MKYCDIHGEVDAKLDQAICNKCQTVLTEQPNAHWKAIYEGIYGERRKKTSDATDAGEMVLRRNKYFGTLDFEVGEKYHKYMRLLYFKGVYRELILSGSKTDTIRRAKGAPKVGQLLCACVGPSRPFAALLVTSVESVSDLAPARLAQVRECYGEIPTDSVRISFAVQDPTA